MKDTLPLSTNLVIRRQSREQNPYAWVYVQLLAAVLTMSSTVGALTVISMCQLSSGYIVVIYRKIIRQAASK